MFVGNANTGPNTNANIGDRIGLQKLNADGSPAAEGVFSTGADIKGGATWFFQSNVWNTFDPGTTLSPKLHHRCWKPVVAAVHGMAAGGAQYFLNEADIIICSDDAEFFDPHANAGIVSALEPIGMLARGVPVGDVLRWALMGTEERITAETALRIGLVDELAPKGGALALALQWAERVQGQSPTSVAACKQLIQGARAAPPRSQLAAEREAFVALFDSEDQREGVQAFLGKRKPQWRNA